MVEIESVEVDHEDTRLGRLSLRRYRAESGETGYEILLDVDNGPGWLASPANAPLYAPEGLAAARAALRPGGVAGIWSPRPNPAFRASLEAAFATVEEHDTAAWSRPEGEPASTVYLARTERAAGG